MARSLQRLLQCHTRQKTFGYFLLLVICLIVGVHYNNVWKISILGETDIDGQSWDRNAKLEQEYRDRLARYQNVCASRKKEIKARNWVNFYNNSDTKGSLGYCSVPKVGTTFWLRLFQFLLRGNKGRNLSSPFDISRFDAYFHPITETNKIHISNYNDDRVTNALRFFFVRDPYTRLLSAYVDKFLLLQYLDWNDFGKTFAESWMKKTCIEDVTFPVFVNKLVLPGKPSNLEPHWRPIHAVCDPCKLFPHVIGKQETFSRDANYILNQVGLGDLMTKRSHKTYIWDEIEQMVKFVFSYRDTKQYLRTCFDNKDIASRLWKAFQINGHLDSSLMFPESKMSSLLQQSRNTSGVVAIVTASFTKEAGAGMSRDEHSKQKRDMMVQMFSTLSKYTMEKLADIYDVDFKMFGYEKYPVDLFPWRYSVERKA